MACGLAYMETLDLPLGHLLTLINLQSIANGAKRGKTREEEEEEFWDFLSRE
jgi:hypothetical protein